VPQARWKRRGMTHEDDSGYIAPRKRASSVKMLEMSALQGGIDNDEANTGD
jgi:hypothetical protein